MYGHHRVRGSSVACSTHDFKDTKHCTAATQLVDDEAQRVAALLHDEQRVHRHHCRQLEDWDGSHRLDEAHPVDGHIQEHHLVEGVDGQLGAVELRLGHIYTARASLFHCM